MYVCRVQLIFKCHITRAMCERMNTNEPVRRFRCGRKMQVLRYGFIPQAFARLPIAVISSLDTTHARKPSQALREGVESDT